MEPTNRINSCKPTIALHNQLTMTSYTEAPPSPHNIPTPSHCMVTCNI